MSLTVGGLGLVSLHRPLAEDFLWPQGDIRSILCAVVFFIVFLLLAHLTNPSESSFRAYLTEQSFRQHLSRLDDEDNKFHPRIRSLATVNSTSSSSFHFANRASVSLRTPKHVFHSFGLFTIAAMVPLVKTDDPASAPDRSIISDSWFVGAFGRWWRGGIIEAWYHDFISRTKDEESWSSGILSMKTLDKQSDYNGLPFTTPTLSTRNNTTRGSPPRLRNRDRPSLKSTNSNSQRSSTPPPLPKSASLPLHTSRNAPTLSSNKMPANSSVPITIPASGPPVKSSLSRVPSSSLFDNTHPLIAQILSQITSSTTHVTELRAQLNEFQATAASSHAQLENEIVLMRERKRGEERERAEVRTRTRGLEEEKRSVESVKRDADKRLKTVLAVRDAVVAKMNQLEKDIALLQARKKSDEDMISTRAQEGVLSEERELGEEVESKKLDVGNREEVIALLGVRARELEERVGGEKEKLVRARELADERRRVLVSQRQRQWAAAAAASVPERNDVFPPDLVSEELPHTGNRSRIGPVPPRHQTQHASVDIGVRPNNLQLGSLSNFNGHAFGQSPPIMRSKGYSIFDEDLLPLHQHSHIAPSKPFSPFSEDGNMMNMNMTMGVSPMSTSLIPSGLISSLDTPSETPSGAAFASRSSSRDSSLEGGMSRSFQSDSDMFLEREWRGSSSSGNMDNRLSLSPKSLDYDHYDRDLFALQTQHQQRHMDKMDMQRAGIRARSDPAAINAPLSRSSTASSHTAVSELPPFFKDADEVVVPNDNTFASNARRWFSNNHPTMPVIAKKGLNPAAKVFSLPTSNSRSNPAPPSYDALNPSGLGSSMLSQSNNSSLLRVFAPSPAEREALQRVLGTTTNASLERLLPSLSDVESMSMPSSPALAHTQLHHSHNNGMLPLHRSATHGNANVNVPNGNKLVFPSWLQALPGMRKPNFSPWDDEDTTITSSSTPGAQ